MSAPEESLRAALTNAGVEFVWQGGPDKIQRLDYARLYGVRNQAEPDFYLPGPGIFVEAKGQMTLHQVTKMLYLSAQLEHPYYVYQHTEEDWDPTIEALVPVLQPPPDSKRDAVRKAYNRTFQERELLHLGKNPGDAAKVGQATAARLRAYVAFFEQHLRQATGAGLLR